MSNRRDIQFMYNPHNKATLLDCRFKVASSDSAGFGITGLKASGRIANVFMHTSATKAAGSPGGTTGPASGIIVVQLQDNYNTLLSSWSTSDVALSGSALLIDASDALLTAGNPYVITTVGDATAANWVTVGVPANITPAVGVSFIAAATGAGTSATSAVQAPAAAGNGIFSINTIGDANLSNSNGAYTAGNGNGMQIILGCYKDSSSDAPVLAAPTDGSIIKLCFYLNNSAQGV